MKGLPRRSDPLLRDKAEGAQSRFLTSDMHGDRGEYIHGGFLFALPDRAMGVTTRQLDPGLRQATIQLDMDFIQAESDAATVDIECHVTKARRGMTFM